MFWPKEKKYFNYDHEHPTLETKQKNPEHFDKMLPWKSLDDLKGEHFTSYLTLICPLRKSVFLLTDYP